MILASLVLAVVTFNPAFPPHQTPNEEMVGARTVSPDGTCKPGVVCAMITVTGQHNNCFFNNVDNGVKGGTPLTIDVTLTGPQGSPVYVYWVNATSTNITINGGVALATRICV